MQALRLLRLANPLVRAVLDSPAHRILSGTLVVVVYRGHRSAREFRIPLRYAELPDGRIVALAVQPECKLWWRSFVEPTAVTVGVRGTERVMSGGLLQGDERRDALRAYVSRFPRARGPLGLRNGETDVALDGAAAAVVAFSPSG